MYSPSPEKQQRFHGVLRDRSDQTECNHALISSARCLPVHQVLEFLHGLRFSIPTAGENLPAVVHADDSVSGVDQETAGVDRRNLLMPFLDILRKMKEECVYISPALPCKLDRFDGRGVAGSCCHSKRRHEILRDCVEHQNL